MRVHVRWMRTLSLLSRTLRSGHLCRSRGATLAALLLTLTTSGCDRTPFEPAGQQQRIQLLGVVGMEFGPGEEGGTTVQGVHFEEQVVNGFLTQTGSSCYGHEAAQACPTGVNGLHTVTVTLRNSSTSTLNITGIDATSFSNCQFVSFNSGLPGELSPGEEFTVSITVNVHDASKKFGVWISVVGEVQ